MTAPAPTSKVPWVRYHRCMTTVVLIIAFATRVSSESHGNDETPYEIWASDQSNSVPDQASIGVKGGFLWIFPSYAVEEQLSGQGEAAPLSCTPGKSVGPCDVLDIFPQDLEQIKADGSSTGKTLEDLAGFGRLHGVLKDPFNRYVNANLFAPGGAYNGIIDVQTKEAVALFQLTKFNTGKGRSVHMSFWSVDGSAVFFANLHGKAVERVNIGRDADGTITSVEFDRSATIGFGINMTIEEEATFFRGNNAFGRPLMGAIVGDYADAELGNLTPNGYCKEDGCGTSQLPDPGRVNNVPICPIPSEEGHVYANFGGGGMFILDGKATPMGIVGEYDKETFNGAGCAGVQVGEQLFMDSGVSAAGSGATHSTFSLYSFDSAAFSDRPNNANVPLPTVVFKDETNTNTIGNVDGKGGTSNDSGQLPGTTTRRDAHGTAATADGKYIHVVDRIQNIVETFNVDTYARTTYDLTSKDGRSGRPEDSDKAGACAAKSVTDDTNLIPNDPAPDLLELTPDGKYFVVALRGPAPVSVGHSAQGSCPGVGLVEVTESGKAGKLVDVIRTTNTIDTAPVPSLAGGIDYVGAERSDVHGAIAIARPSQTAPPSPTSTTSAPSPTSTTSPPSPTETESWVDDQSSSSSLNLGLVQGIMYVALAVFALA